LYYHILVRNIRLDAAESGRRARNRKTILAADVCLFSTEAAMSGIWFFNVHCSWEDWVSMLIGMVIAISPWLAEAGLDVERRGTRSKQVICDPITV
jgi:hypothetical protein